MRHSPPLRGRDALARFFREHDLVDDVVLPELRDAVRLFCDDVRRRDLLPEQMLVVVKELWASTPGARAPHQSPESRDLLGRVVSLCISEYFDGKRPTAEPDTGQS